MQRQRSILALMGAVSVSLLLSVSVQAGDRYGNSRDGYQRSHQSSHQNGRHDGYSGASRHGNDGRHDGYSGATPHKESWDLSPETHRALRSFEWQKQRDYRRLGQQRFDSHRARERAYRELRQQHQDRLRNILGDSRFNDERYRHYRDTERRHGQNRRGASDDFDTAAIVTSLAAQWAHGNDSREDLADALEDLRDDVEDFRTQRFDNPLERRDAQWELQQDARDELADALDDTLDDGEFAELIDILMPYLN